MNSTASATDWLPGLLRDDVTPTALLNGVTDVVGGVQATGSARRFEGWYGQAYSAVMREPVLRRPLFGMLGDAGAVQNLDMLVQRIACETPSSDAPLLDVPCGQGVVGNLLARARWAGRLVSLDLALHAVDRAAAATASLPRIDARAVRGDALAMPFRDGAMSGAVSINGLHVMPDHARFLSELARVVQPGGSIWLVTIVSTGERRSELLVKAAMKLGVATVVPPSRQELDVLVAGAGLTVADDLGTGNFTALRLVHREV